MKSRKLSSLYVILFLSIYIVQAQEFTFHLSSEIGVSTFYRTTNNDPSLNGKGVTSRFKVGYGVGVLAKYKIKDNLLIGTGLEIQSQGAKEEKIIQEFYKTVDNINFVESYIYDDINITSRYFGIPLFVEYRLNSLSLTAGYQINRFIGGKYKINRNSKSGLVPSSVMVSQSTDNESVKFTNWDSGLIFSLLFIINNKIAAGFNYYHGLNDISTELEPEEVYRKNKLLSIGIQYCL